EPAVIVSGPMLGAVELRSAIIWLQVSAEVRSVTLEYWKECETGARKKKNFEGRLGSEFNPVQLEIGGLDVNSTYQYRFLLNNIASAAAGFFHTKDLWQWRKPAPDFSFLTGSCAYFNDPAYDRPGKPY